MSYIKTSIISFFKKPNHINYKYYIFEYFRDTAFTLYQLQYVNLNGKIKITNLKYMAKIKKCFFQIIVNVAVV